MFEDEAYSKSGANLHPSTYALLLYGPSILFPRLRVLRVDIVHLRAPFISPSIVELTILITGEEMGENEVIGNTLRNASASLSNVEVLRLDGDRRARYFIASLGTFCLGLPRLKRVVMSPCILMPSFLRLLSRIPHLNSVEVSQVGADHTFAPWRKAFSSLSTVVVFQPGRFSGLKKMSLLVTNPSVIHNMLHHFNSPANSLEELLVRFPPTPHGHTRCSQLRELLRGLGSACPSLSSLTLRFAFASAAKDFYDQSLHEEQFCFDDIAAFLSILTLKSFSIDHNRPLIMNDTHLHAVGEQGGRLQSLWLNPYPVTELSRSADCPTIRGVEWLALGCPLLERLALQLDASGDVGRAEPLAHFKCLREYVVGWSHVPAYRVGWSDLFRLEALARYMSLLFGKTTVFKTVLDFEGLDGWHNVGWENDIRGVMNLRNRDELLRNSIAWNVVFGMVFFIHRPLAVEQ